MRASPRRAFQAEPAFVSFAEDAVGGLTASPKWLMAKYFYDRAGSELFEQITLLPEYYPTRCELERSAGARRRDRALAAAERGAGRIRRRLQQEDPPIAAGRRDAARLCAGRYFRRVSQGGSGGPQPRFPRPRRGPGRRRFHAAFRPARRRAGRPARRLLPRLHHRQFRAQGRAPLHPPRRRNPRARLGADRRRRSGEGRGRAARGL